MKIKEIEIIDFKGIKNIKINLNENINFLVAENNVGKTRVLESVKAFYDKEKDCNIKVIFEITDEEKTLLKESLSEDELANRISIELRESKHYYNGVDLKTKISKDKILGYYIYIPSTSDHEDNSNPSKPNILRDLFNEVFSCEGFGCHLEKFNSEFQKLYDKFSENSKNQIDGINDSITIDGFKVRVDKKEIISETLIKNNLELKVDESGTIKNLSELGTGIQRNIINAILCTKKNEKFLIYLYDEPETFLNPTTQRDLIEKLYANNENSQFLVATHSPYCIIRKCDIFNSIIRLKKINGNNLEIFQYDSDKFSLKAQSYNSFFDTNFDHKLKEDINKSILKFWEINRINGLFERRILICEGPTEELFFDLVINPKKILPIINSIGKFSIPYYIILFKEIFGIEVYVVCDKDSDEGKHKIVNDWLKENSSKNLFLDKDLESELGYTANRDNHKKLDEFLDKHFSGEIDKKEGELAERIIGFWEGIQ